MLTMGRLQKIKGVRLAAGRVNLDPHQDAFELERVPEDARRP
jgi:hypothetical protein